MSANLKYQNQINRERPLEHYLPYSSHLTANTIKTRKGDYIRIFRIAGISFETSDIDDIILHKTSLNKFLQSIAEAQTALWTHNVRRYTQDQLDGSFTSSFARAFNEKYTKSFDEYKMMANELYLTLVYRPEPSKVVSLINKARLRSQAERQQEQDEALKALDDLTDHVEAGLKKYQPDLLGTFQENGVVYSRMLEFLNYLVSGEWQKVRVPDGPLYDYLGTSWLRVGTETIEIRSPTRIRYAQCIDFKNYNGFSEPGILNDLMYEGYEYVITQSFTFMSKRDGKEYLERQQRRLISTEDAGTNQIAEMELAKQQLINGDFSMGEYHFTLMVFGDSVKQVRKNAKLALDSLNSRGFLAVLVTTATDAAFYSQLPGNWLYRPRIAGLTSRNFAGLCAFHNFFAGKRDGNPWGQAVLLLKTPSGQPLYLNFHYSQSVINAYGKKLLGNTRIIGQSGSGKTVLLNVLLLMAQKFAHKAPLGFSTIFFDRDEGAKLSINALGGKYLSVKSGELTGFNPFQALENTDNHIIFLEKLVKELALRDGKGISTKEELQIGQAVKTVMRMPKALRRLSVLLQNITEDQNKENSLVKRLSKWCHDDGTGRKGVYAWVFDCPTDELDFSRYQNYGIDGTDFLSNDDVRGPISMYLLYRMREIIDGRRFIYLMDEAWQWIDDKVEDFRDFAGKEQVSIRKKDGLGVFSTQMPAQILRSKIAKELIQQIATEICLPNPKADYTEYVKELKYSETEYSIIKGLGEESRMFLVKQGHHSTLAQLDLRGFDDELAILSGSSDNNQLYDEIVGEVGNNPDVWIPIFHQRRKERLEQSRVNQKTR